ncbi:OsmC family protein [Thiohalomonas denitrificans]|uniref:OsmC family protein n=1 Tax=Thiohalomonas denitrificans TaxID=415747 RepID=UPI0026EB1B7B|nr:OsmC family protein [Thiohalomonas denitrificans]
MKVIQHAETDIELSELYQAGFDVDMQDPEAQFSALQLFATSLGLCTFSVLAAYGAHLAVDPAGIRIRLRWQYSEHPMRVSDIDMGIIWPDLPADRLEAAERAAEHCTLHHTLAQPPAIRTRVDR